MVLLDDALEQEGEEAGALQDKLWTEGHQTTLLCEQLTQAEE